MKYLCIILFLCAQTLLLQGKTHPTTLKAFIVCETHEPALRQCYQQDSIRMKKSLESIAAQLKLALKIQTVRSACLSNEKLSSWLQKLSSKDVAVFYYAGKPYYQLQEQWPSLEFTRTLQMLSQDRLTNMINAKKPHLGLVLFDCYSNILRSGWVPSMNDGLRKVISKSGMRRLFLRSSGIFAACSKHRDEIGYAFHQKGLRGGIFTFAMQRFFHSCDSNSVWYDLGAATKPIALRMSDEKQSPLVYENVTNPPVHHDHIKSQPVKK